MFTWKIRHVKDRIVIKQKEKSQALGTIRTYYFWIVRNMLPSLMIRKNAVDHSLSEVDLDSSEFWFCDRKFSGFLLDPELPSDGSDGFPFWRFSGFYGLRFFIGFVRDLVAVSDYEDHSWLKDCLWVNCA